MFMIGIGISDLYFLVPANLFLLIVFYKSKFPRYIFLFLLVALSYSYVDLADYNGYSQMYDGPNGNMSGLYFLDSTDVGFRILVYLGNYLNLSFELFKAIIYFIFGLLLIKGLVRIDNKSANLVLSLYIFYPLLLDLVQIRHFIAMTTFIFTMSFFLDAIRNNKVNIYSYAYFILTLLFHSSFAYLIFLVFFSHLLLRHINIRDFIKKNILLLIISYLIIFVLLLFLNLSNSSYFSTQTSLYTILFYVVVYLFFYLILILIKNRISCNYNKTIKIYNFVIIYTTLLIGTTLPMLLYNVEFFRYFRVELLILLSMMFSILQTSMNTVNWFYITIIFLTYISLSLFIFYIYYFENLIYPLLFMENFFN